MRVVLRPEAEADVSAAFRYYHEGDPDLATRFVEELDRLLGRLEEFPRSAQQVMGYDSVRRALVRGFPFAVFYLDSDEQIVVLRIMHTARHPESWPAP